MLTVGETGPQMRSGWYHDWKLLLNLQRKCNFLPRTKKSAFKGMKTLSCYIKKYIYAHSKNEAIAMLAVDTKDSQFKIQEWRLVLLLVPMWSRIHIDTVKYHFKREDKGV